MLDTKSNRDRNPQRHHGRSKRALIGVVAYLAAQFPNMTNAELSQALQVAQTAAERNALCHF